MKKQPRDGRPKLPEKPLFEYRPVTPARLDDLRAFSERHGRFRYCSCMRWRMSSAEYKRSSKEERVAVLEDQVRRKVPVGVLAYANGEPVGWCSIAPRETYVALERSGALKRVDGAPAWSVVCFFVDARFRRRGVRAALLKAAVAYAQSCGATLVEAYPGEPGGLYGFMGTRALFEAAGFRDVAPVGGKRRVFRARLFDEF